MVMLSSPASAYLFPHAALVLLMVAGHGGNGGTKDGIKTEISESSSRATGRNLVLYKARESPAPTYRSLAIPRLGAFTYGGRFPKNPAHIHTSSHKLT